MATWTAECRPLPAKSPPPIIERIAASFVFNGFRKIEMSVHRRLKRGGGRARGPSLAQRSTGDPPHKPWIRVFLFRERRKACEASRPSKRLSQHRTCGLSGRVALDRYGCASQAPEAAGGSSPAIGRRKVLPTSMLLTPMRRPYVRAYSSA